MNEDQKLISSIEKEINSIVDTWTAELLKDKILTPQITPERQRGIWDRIKGGISNLWHGIKTGRYDPKNPYYWKNRFGDDLGVDESVEFKIKNFKEYRQILEEINKTEQLINESLPYGSENLRIVKIIKSAAEDLKKNLLKVFVSFCHNASTQNAQTQSSNAELQSNNNSNQDVTKSVATMDQEIYPASTEKEDKVVNSKETEENVEEKEKKEKEKYEVLGPKPDNEIEGMSLDQLVDKSYIIDAILHDDFSLVNVSISKKAAEDEVLKLIYELEKIGEKRAAAGSVIEKKKLKKVIEAKKKLKKIIGAKDELD